jgi:predicted transcriptional regulator
MRRISFQEWLAKRPEEVPDTMRLAMLIARSGTAGISREGLRRVCGLSSDTLDDLLKALVAAGQVRVLKVNGQMVYRATM